jgi:hypothetical protein
VKRFALAGLLVLFCLPSLAEPYRPLPRLAAERVTRRIRSATDAPAVTAASAVTDAPPARPEPPGASEPVVADTPAPPPGGEGPLVIEIPSAAAQASRAEEQLAAGAQQSAGGGEDEGDEEEEDNGVSGGHAGKGEHAPGVIAGPSSGERAPTPPAAQRSAAADGPADLKVTLGQGRAAGQFTMLLEDPSGARIELTLDVSGRLLGVQSASR